MPAVVRQTIDTHSGHARLDPSAPFHRTNYVDGSSNVKVNGFGVVRVGDKTACGDPAKTGSPRVFANKIAIHRVGDATDGHDNFQENFAATGSHSVFLDDLALGVTSVKGVARSADDTASELAEVITLAAGGNARESVDEDADDSADGALFGAAQFGRSRIGGNR